MARHLDVRLRSSAIGHEADVPDAGVEVRFRLASGMSADVVAWESIQRIGGLADSSISKGGPGGVPNFFGGSDFRRGGARSILELGKNIHEEKARDQKTSHTHGDRLV